MFDLGKVIAHRGAPAYAPENTLASFHKAKEYGAKTVEFDVMLTRCGEAIVFHDDTLQRTTDGRGKISELDYAQISSLDAGSWFASEFKGEQIPLFKDAIKCLVSLNLHANIEIKAANGAVRNISEGVLSQLNQYWPVNLDRPLISSFNYESLGIIRELDSSIPIGMLLAHWDNNWQQLADKLSCVAIHCNYLQLNEKKIKEIKNTGRLVLAYTVNSKAKALRLFDLGVDAVFSDYPDLLQG